MHRAWRKGGMKMYQVKKRDGKIVPFDVHKISHAIRKAFDACGRQYNDSVIDMIALRVTSDFEPKIREGTIDVEDIQDSAEKVLSESGYSDVSKSYILYRKQRENIRNINATSLDYKKLVDSYLQALDWKERENSNATYSVGGLILSNSGAITANYWLSEVYDEEISRAYRNGDIHIHDLSMLTGECAGWSLKQLLEEGLGGIAGKITSGPAKHLSTLCYQMVNFLGIMQNEWAGAQSFSGFDTYLAPFVKADQLSYEQVKQCMDSFICGVNTPSRWGTQAPFTTITMDWTVPEDLMDAPCIVGGKQMDFHYADCQKEMDLINRAFLEVMLAGDYEGKRYPYPLVTYAITRNFSWADTENNRLLFRMAEKDGSPYFANYIHSGLKQDEVRSFRNGLYPDPSRLYRRAGGSCGSGEMTGSIGSVTINLPRIAYLSKNQEDFFHRLDRLTDISARALKTKRTVITKLLDTGLYPYTGRYLGSFDHTFSSISIIGMNEACLNARWLGKDLTDPDSRLFTAHVLEHLQDRLKACQAQYGDLYSLDAVPKRTAGSRLARHDTEKYPDIITAMDHDIPYYTDASRLSADCSEDIFTALDIEDPLISLYTAGGLFRARLEEPLSDWRSAAVLVRKIAENYRLPYFALSPCRKEKPETEEEKEAPEAEEKEASD
jgi:anaerobic ribonucleoside-triphosphate reductase